MNWIRKRKKIAISILLITICLCLSIAVVYRWGQERQMNLLQQNALSELDRNRGEYDEQSIVLQATSKARAEELAELLGATLRITADGRYARLALPSGITIRDVYAEKENREYLEEMSADYRASVSDMAISEKDADERLPIRPQYTVSDTDYEQQIHLDYLNMSDVWSKYTGSGITVAVIDTGVDTDHPEFAGRISEYSYNATEDKIVKDWLIEDGSYDWSLVEDEHGHGTSVTGVIAASMNSENVVGIAPNVSVIAIKVECDESGNFLRTSDLVFGLYYAIERDVQVVNMSFGTNDPSNPFAEAVQLAYDSDVICVAAAGNEGTTALTYPAADEKVIGVGALAEDSWELAEYSNYGENSDLVAPGTTYTTLMGGSYGNVNGTSVAAPVVASAIALYMQSDKYTTLEEVTEILYASCYDLGNLGNDWDYGFGALDVSAFLLEERGTVSFDMLTDEMENTEALFIRGHALQELPEPERLYAVFDGWYYDDTFTQAVDYYTDAFEGDLTLYAKWANEDDGVPYTYVILEDGTVEIRSYTGHRRYITIPEKIEGRVVSSIGEFAFSGQTRLREVTLPSGLTHIGRYAFENCANLIHIEIPEGVQLIGEYAFSSNTRLSTVAFHGNSHLTTIGDFAFASCGKLERIELPATLTSVNGSAFYGAIALHTINVQEGNVMFTAPDGVLYNMDRSTLVAYPAAHSTTYKLPEQTTVIADYAFAFAKIYMIDLANVVTVGNSAFENSSLKEVVIPDGVNSMGAGAFAYNISLSSVTLGGGLTDISAAAFSGCSSLTEIAVPKGVTTIGGSAFAGSGLVTVTFEEGSVLTTIGNGAFSCSALETVELPASLTVISGSAFWGTPLVRVGFAENSELRTIGANAFEQCWLLKTIDLPDSLESIGEKAFLGSGLTAVTIPASVTEFGAGAFAECADLSAIKVEEGNAVYHDIDGVVYNLANTEIHAYPSGRETNDYTIETTTVTVMPWAFAGAANLKTVQLPETLVQISERAFQKCVMLQSIRIPDNVTQIGRNAFAMDWNLKSVTFNTTAKLPRIGYESFAYCGITSFTAPANVSTMAQGAFKGCNKLTSFTFAANSKLESISAYMFDGCTGLKSITFSSGSALTSIQAHGLEGMDSLTSINFGNAKVTNIDNFAFRFCESLSSLKLPETVTNIGRYAFYGCSSLSELTIPTPVEHIGSYAFLGTDELDLYFASDVLPAYLDENWDHGTQGYYVGVTDVITEGDFKYAVRTTGDIAIIEYLGDDSYVDLTALDFGAPITAIGGSAFKDSTVVSVILPDTLTLIQAEAFQYTALESITIPAGVTFIGREAFSHTAIKTLSIAENAKLTVIEQYAFEDTENLTAVTLPASLTTLGTGAFSESGLTTLRFESGSKLTEIPQRAFANTKLTAVALPDSVTLVNHNAFNGVETLKSVSFGSNDGIRLMSNAFYHTGMETLHIPSNVTYIGEYCFVALPNLKEFTVDESNPNYTAVDGLLLTKSGRKLIAAPAGRTGSLTVPLSVEEIGFGAFEESKLSEVQFHEDANILTFGYRAFFKAKNITQITIPASVVSIDYYAFAYCENLQTVTFAEGNQLKGIYEGAFLGDINLANITVPDSIVEISDFAFYGCSKITKLPICENNALKGIYDYAFAYSGLSGEFTTPETLYDIGNYAFLSTKLTKVTVPDTNKKQLIIGIGAFEDCNKLTEITLPFIGASFEDDQISWLGYIFGAGSYEANETYVPESLKTVTITDGITAVYIGGFAYCTGLETVNLPHSVSALWNDAFKNTTARYELTNAVTTYNTSWSGISTQAEQSHFGKGIAGKLVLSDDVSITSTYSGNLFYNCHYLNNVTLPNGMETIGVYMFGNCNGLKQVTIPDSVTTIDDFAFYGCLNLVSINISPQLEAIGDYAFVNCSLTNIVLPETLSKIGSYAFHDCTHLYEIINYSALELTFGSMDHGGIANYARSITDSEGNVMYRDGVTEEIYLDTTDGFRFQIVDGNYVLRGYVGTEAVVTLPETINSCQYQIKNFYGAQTVIVPGSVGSVSDNAFYDSGVVNVILEEGITSIGNRAFYSCGSLESILLPSTLFSIGDNAFDNCQLLKDINIPNSVAKIGKRAFYCCYKISDIQIPDGITHIEDSTFQRCFALTEVELPDSVVSIGSGAFNRCEKLNSVRLSENVTSIGSQAFAQCTSLEKIVLPDSVYSVGAGAFPATANVILPTGNSNFQIIDGIMYDVPATQILHVSPSVSANVTIPEGVTKIPDYAFQNCTALRSIIIPQGVIKISNYAFQNCTALRSIVIPQGVTSLGDGVFQGSGLETVILPEGLISIASSFRDCKNLKSITLPESITRIDNSFNGCTNLVHISIPDGVTTIGNSTFRDCKNLEKITIPDSVKSIGSYAFYGCASLKKINIPIGITSLPEYAFDGCGFTHVDIPDTVTSIGDLAFMGCTNLVSVTIPDTVTTLGSYAFGCCYNLFEVNIPNSVSTISSRAFSSCRSLYRVTLGTGLTTVGDNAFDGCTNLLEITNYSNLELSFGSAEQGKVAYYANAIIDQDGNKTYYDAEKDFEVIETSDGFRFVREDGVYTLLAYLGDEETITLPETINGSSYQMYQFQGGKTVIIPDSFTTISEYAFWYNKTVECVIIPDSVKTIGAHAFHYCPSLVNVSIPDSVTLIGNGAFSSCYSLTSISIPNSVRSIGNSTFSGCRSLTSVTVPDRVTSIGNSAFYGCNSLTSVTIPEGVSSLGDGAFKDCTSLMSVPIPDSVSSLGDGAFKDCTSLMSVPIPDSVTSIGSDAFANTAYSNNPENWENGLLIIDGWLIDVNEDLKYIPHDADIKGIATGAYTNCQLLKNPIWSSTGISGVTNAETIIVSHLTSTQLPSTSSLLTLKNIVVLDSVGLTELRSYSSFFKKLTGVTIFVENSEEDLRWDDNFPGWNNGNRVIYSDDWSWSNFYDENGNLLYCAPRRNSEVVRRPAYEIEGDSRYICDLIGWDIDGDGIADSIPATTIADVNAKAVIYNHDYKTVVIAPTCSEDGYTAHTCANCGDYYTDSVVAASGHAYVNGICSACGDEKYAITQKGRTLSYEDLIYVIDIFDLTGVEGIDLSKDAGLLIWSVEEFEAMAEIAFDADHANVGLRPYRDTDYYCGSSDGIFTRDLYKEAYYVGYVKLADGSYIYSEPRLYSPAIYAYNMLEKDTTSAETKELCVALLNYISTAQVYFHGTAEDDLVNYALTDEQKALVWNEEITFNLAPEISADKQVDRDYNVFTGTGKNLLFEEMISIVSIYMIDDTVIADAQEYGTIYWTAEQFAALEGAPSIDNIGSGTKTGMSVYRGNAGQWCSHAPEVAAKDMADTQYYYMGYVVHADGSVSYSGVISYTVEQYIYNKVNDTDTSNTMLAFAQRLYHYERAAKAALKS